MEQKDSTPQIAFRPSPETYERIKQEAEENGRSLTKQVEITIKEFWEIKDKLKNK